MINFDVLSMQNLDSPFKDSYLVSELMEGSSSCSGTLRVLAFDRATYSLTFSMKSTPAGAVDMTLSWIV